MPFFKHRKDLPVFSVDEKYTDEFDSPIPDFEAMTVDELIEWKLARKMEIEAIKEIMRAAHIVYTRKLIEWHAQEALKRVGLEGVVVSPGPAVLKLEGK